MLTSFHDFIYTLIIIIYFYIMVFKKDALDKHIEININMHVYFKFVSSQNILKYDYLYSLEHQWKSILRVLHQNSMA